jgi:uncharacterized protein involved in exopolysaccharide biosynthesis
MKSPAYLPARDPGRREPEADTLDIGAHLHVLWRNRLLLLGCAVLGGVVSLTVGVMGPREYVAEAALAISRPKIGEGLPASELMSTANFRPLIESRAIAARVIKDTGLDQAPYFVSPSSFFNQVVEVAEVRASSVMTITGRLPDPQLVARVVNRVVEVGVETARRVNQQEAQQTESDIKLQRDEAKTRLDQATENLQLTRVASQLELVKSDVASELKERSTLLNLDIMIESERSRLARIETELNKRKQLVDVRRSIDSDPAASEAARALQTPSKELLSLQINNQELSTVYQDLDKAMALSRTKLAAMERQKAQMDSRHLSTGSLATLNNLYSKEAKISRLETERDLANDVYKDLAKSYETARLMVIGRTSALQVLSTAIPPDRPESRKLARSVLIGSMSGLLLAALVLLVVHAFRTEDHLPQGSRV